MVLVLNAHYRTRPISKPLYDELYSAIRSRKYSAALHRANQTVVRLVNLYCASIGDSPVVMFNITKRCLCAVAVRIRRGRSRLSGCEQPS